MIVHRFPLPLGAHPCGAHPCQAPGSGVLHGSVSQDAVKTLCNKDVSAAPPTAPADVHLPPCKTCEQRNLQQ